jgi:hypothetical protein
MPFGDGPEPLLFPAPITVVVAGIEAGEKGRSKTRANREVVLG